MIVMPEGVRDVDGEWSRWGRAVEEIERVERLPCPVCRKRLEGIERKEERSWKGRATYQRLGKIEHRPQPV